jgi:hypothetical protein
MKKVKYLTSVMLLLFVSFFFFSCSKNLSRSEASVLIMKKYNLPQIESKEINKSYFKNSKYVDYCSFPKVSIYIGDRITYSDNENVLIALKEKGLINISETVEQEREYDEDNTYAIVLLTDEGRKYLINESKEKFIVKTCEITFGEITGIQMQEQVKVAEVNYTLKRINCTPFGNEGSQEIENRTDSFSLLDDGWRIN